MEDIEEVRNRIQQRKKPQILTDHSFHSFYKVAITSMICLALGLMASCYYKTHPNIDILAYIDEHVLTIIPSINFEKKKSVSTLSLYENVGNQMYRCEGEDILSLSDGIVQSVDNNNIVILYQNGVEATYSHLARCFVDKYDRIKKDEPLATYEQQFSLMLTKNNQEVNLEDVFD